MAVPLVGSNALFPRLGSVAGIVNSQNLYRGSTIPAKVTALAGLYGNDPADIGNLFLNQVSWQGSQAGFLAYLQQLFQQTIISMINLDVVQTDKTLLTAITTLISQMLTSSDTVQANAVGAGVTPSGTNSGNPSWVVSTRAPNGLNLELMFAETLTATVSSDAQTGGTSPGSEPITVKGQVGSTTTLDSAWPGGSNASLLLTAVDAGLDQPGGARQMLRNGDFEAWSVANTPDNWAIATGTPGTQVFQGGSPYTGSYAAKFAGDGTTLTAIGQQFGVNNSARIAPFTQYAFNCFVKADVVPAAGVLQVALVDGSGSVINDAQGNPNSVSLTLSTGITTSYAPLKGMFRTPRVLPSSVNLRVKLTTAMSAGSNLFVDRMAFTTPQNLYIGGPYVAAFSGSNPMIKGDSFALATTNDFGGKIQTAMGRLCGMQQLGLLLPSVASSPTIPDSLVS